jgi:hypothetical protein
MWRFSTETIVSTNSSSSCFNSNSYTDYQVKMARTRKTQVRTNGRQIGHLRTNAGICISPRKRRIFKQGLAGKIKTKAIQQHVLTSAKIELFQPRVAQRQIADCLISFGCSRGRPYPFFSSSHLWQLPFTLCAVYCCQCCRLLVRGLLGHLVDFY